MQLVVCIFKGWKTPSFGLGPFTCHYQGKKRFFMASSYQPAINQFHKDLPTSFNVDNTDSGIAIGFLF